MAIRDDTVERRSELFEEALEVIRRDYRQPVQLDSVARELATSRRQLQRAFAEIGGTSFRQVLAAVRMERARSLLAETRLPVRGIGASVGYHQPAQFSKCFRRHHGVPPTSFRRTLAGADRSPASTTLSIAASQPSEAPEATPAFAVAS